MPTTAQQQAAIPAGMQAAAVAMLRAGDPASALARRQAIEAIRAAGYAGYDDAALAHDLANVPGFHFPGGTSPLPRLGGQLAAPAKEWFLAEVVRAGLADGPLTSAEREAAARIAEQLGMTQAQSLGVITLAERAASGG